MAKPFEIISSPFAGAEKALVFPWPSGYSEREAFACRDAHNSVALIRFDDGALLLAELPTFAPRHASPVPGCADWSALRATPTLSLGELLKAKTWKFSENCQRRLVQMWLKEGAGWFTARSGRDTRGLQPFEDRLLQRILLEVSELCMGSTPQVNAVVSCNRQWSPAAVPYLHEMAAAPIGLRTRIQVLELSKMFGIELPLCADGIRFDMTEPCFAQLEKPNENAQAIAALLGCSAMAIRHVLRHRDAWTAALSGLPRRTQQSVIRGLDAIGSRSHWPRNQEQLCHHIQSTQRALRIAEIGDVKKWQAWANRGGVNPEVANARLDEVLATLSKVRGHLFEARTFRQSGLDSAIDVDQTMRLLGHLILQKHPKELAEVPRQVYSWAQTDFLEETADRCAKNVGTDAWSVVESKYQALLDWSAESASTGLRLRLLLRRSAFEDWGAIAVNCLTAAGAVMAYAAHLRLIVAVEHASLPHSPIATLAMGATAQDRQDGLPNAVCRSISELQLVHPLRALSDQLRSQRSMDVEMACAEIEADGSAIWCSKDSYVSQWRRTASSFGVEYESTRSALRVGAYLPAAIRRLAEEVAMNDVLDGRLQCAD